MTEQNSPQADCCFLAERHLSGLIEKAVLHPGSVCIEHPELGKLVIDPITQCFSLFSMQPEKFCQAPASQLHISTSTLPVASIARHGHLEDLRWIAAWHASDGKLPPGCSLYDVVELPVWPNLTRLPATPEIMRLCALLNRQPHCLHLAHRLLGVSREDACRFYCAALQAGLLVRHSHAATADYLPPPEPPSEAGQESTTLLLVLHQLWNKLTRRTS